MAQIDLFLRVSSPLTRVGFLRNHSYQNVTNVCQKLFISDMLNISNQLITLSIIITILTIYGHIKWATFDYAVIFNLMNDSNHINFSITNPLNFFFCNSLVELFCPRSMINKIIVFILFCSFENTSGEFHVNSSSLFSNINRFVWKLVSRKPTQAIGDVEVFDGLVKWLLNYEETNFQFT